MTYMPEFIHSTADFSHQCPVNAEADLLWERSRESLSCLLVKLNPAAPESVYKARLETELGILEEHGFSGYFLIVADYVQWAKDNGIAVGPGRGSGPCSLVGFALGITNVDPIKYDLPFERFVNPDRQTLPDFDVDFCDKRQSEVTNYIQSKYGPDRVAQISSHDTTPLTSRLVICDRPLTELVTLYPNPESGFPVAKMTMEQIKDAGLVQFNAINQKALTINQRVVKELTKSGAAIDLDNIPLDDKGAYSLLSAGEASNIAALDDEQYKTALTTVQPDRFQNLCAVIGMSQPRFLQNHIPLYAERSRIPELIQYFHPALEDITAETYGLILYQEQVMHIAHKIAGFSFAQGDSFCRVLKNTNQEAIFIQKNKFIDGAMNFGLLQADAIGLFDHIALSGPRYFNKSHAVAYAMIAYQTAWLKANHPHEFAKANSVI